jgi:DNA-binding beta-propeller fold protein YncE
LNFIFNTVAVNQQTGTVEVDVTEGSSGCQPPNCPVQPLYVTKFPNGWGQVSYTATPSPPIVPYNSGPTLQWSGPAGATYAIDYYLPQSGIVHVPAPNAPALSNAGVYPGQTDPPLQLTQNTTFYLSVTETINNVSYKDQQQITVTVIPPQPKITKFCASTQQVPAGFDITFEWTTDDTQYCALSCSASELTPNAPQDGFLVTVPQLDASYTLTASGGTAFDTSTLRSQWTAIQIFNPFDAVMGAVATSADGKHAYAVTGSLVQIYIVNADGTLKTGDDFNTAAAPQGLAVSPDGTRLYVVLLTAGIGILQVYGASGAPMGPMYPLGRKPWGVATSPDGTRVYVLNCYDATISTFAVNADPNNPLQPIGAATPCGRPVAWAGLAVSSDGSKLYSGLLGAIDVFQTTPDTTYPLKPIAQVNVGAMFDAVTAIAAGQKFPYVAAIVQGAGPQGQVLLLDPTTLAGAAQSLGPFNMPAGVAVCGSSVYAAHFNGVTVHAPRVLTGGVGC